MLNASGMLEVTPVVARGQTVTIVLRRRRYRGARLGEALADGSHGQTVRVRNHRTQRVLSGTVKRRTGAGVAIAAADWGKFAR
ncbi:MAG: flagella basal body P-ring formation protein FlgA [Chromatiales bacterium]|nr:flagella basal body P-ring formation protein FlgA [Chromatiales bacterium]